MRQIYSEQVLEEILAEYVAGQSYRQLYARYPGAKTANSFRHLLHKRWKASGLARAGKRSVRRPMAGSWFLDASKRDAVLRGLALLDELDQDILLARLRGDRLADIGEQLGCSRQWVHCREQRALRVLGVKPSQDARP